ncbi:MAG: 3'-5' exonuclease, partial [Marmoricola sp.]
MPWRGARYVVVDVETTGLDLGKDEIISIGAVEVIDGRVSSEHFYRVVHTERPISVDAIRIHCLTQEDLVGAPAVGDVLAELRELVSGAAIVAHAAWVERAFLNRQLRMVGERVPDQLVDTAALARALDLAPVGRQEPSLEGLAKRLNLPVYTPHHALMDAITTAVLFLALAHRV